MTATVTPPHILDKFDDLAPMSGDNLTRLTYGLLDIRKPAGQLWERVAEGRIRGEVYPAALAEQRADNYADSGTAALNIELRHGHPWLRRFTNDNGIIHAGERIK